MHQIEPYYNWISFYSSEDDELSPYFGKNHSELYFTNKIYNHLIHPQWDDFGSDTLYLKIIFVDYQAQFAIIELIGEWNDCINNDIMLLKRDIIDIMLAQGINQYIIIGENVLNFHASDELYYEEWFQDIEDGWVVFVNFLPHVLSEMSQVQIDYYINYGGDFDAMEWRINTPIQFYEHVKRILSHRLG